MLLPITVPRRGAWLSNRASNQEAGSCDLAVAPQLPDHVADADWRDGGIEGGAFRRA
jgi:hypothetical protein